jgi:hypothetical protein
MPDSRTPRGSDPHDWRDALSALPLETPPEDGWARLSSRLPTASPTSTGHGVGRNTRMRRLGWLASAAVLAVAVTVPLQRLHDADHATVSDSRPDSSGAIATGAITNDPAPGTSAASAGSDPDMPMPPGKADAIATPVGVSASPHARESDPPPVTQAPPASNGIRSTAALDPDGNGSESDLERLHAESARLEALVALARDNDVGNAAAMVLATGLDDRLGAIDAALSQSPLTPTERNRLWRTRVDTLRELAGVETTQRWLAAQGQPFDSGLVLVN